MYLLPCNMCVWANLDECFYIGNGTVRMKLFSVFFCASTMRSHYKVSRISKCWAYDAVLWCMCICCWWCSWQISTIILDERNRGEDCVAYIFDCVDHVILWPLDQIAKGNETKRNGQQNHRHLLQQKTKQHQQQQYAYKCTLSHMPMKCNGICIIMIIIYPYTYIFVRSKHPLMM